MNSPGKYIYDLSSFKEMGTTNKPYNERQSAEVYHNKGKNIVYENYIFHTSFSETKLNNTSVDNSLLMELRDEQNQTIIGVLGIARDRAKYSVYTGKESYISLSSNIDKDTIYLGEELKINVLTSYEQQIVNTKKIFDTRFFDQQLGLKITIHDKENRQLGIDSLLGIRLKLNDNYYSPDFQGAIRLRVSENISNTLSKIVLETKDNEILDTGDYKIKIESFGSADGIYYSTLEPQYEVKNLRITNNSYGLKVRTAKEMKIVDKKTGKTKNGNNALNIYVGYKSNLVKPKLKMHLERRKYDNVYSKEYEKVDFQKYISTTLVKTPDTDKTKEYLISNEPAEGERLISLNLKENLKTGTYRIMVDLYDDKKLIGTAYEYLIIK